MIYVYEDCCGQRHERTCSLASYEADPGYSCPVCGRSLAQVVTAPRLLHKTKPFEAFKSPVDGSIITCDRDLREHNKRNGVVNVHDGYDDKAVKGMVNRDFQKPLDEERRSDLVSDMREAVVKLEQGHKPQTVSEDAPL